MNSDCYDNPQRCELKWPVPAAGVAGTLSARIPRNERRDEPPDFSINMNLDLESQSAERSYSILAALITPRPIALITTLGPDGIVNAAPFSFFNVMGANPPIIAFAPGFYAPGTTEGHPRIFIAHGTLDVTLPIDQTSRLIVPQLTDAGYDVEYVEFSGVHSMPSEIVDRAIEKGTLPPRPSPKACSYCDFQLVCGRQEERRTGRKERELLADLEALRGMP